MESNKKIFRSNSIRTLCTLPLFLLPIAEMNGTTTYAQSVQFSFSLSNSTVKEVLEQIENESEFVFVYYENTFDPSKKVSINANGKEVDEILDEVFAGVAGQVLRRQQHDADHREGQHRQGDAQIEHRGQHADEGHNRVDELRQALADHLAQRIGIVGVQTHDGTVGILIEITDRKCLHVLKHIITHAF